MHGALAARMTAAEMSGAPPARVCTGINRAAAEIMGKLERSKVQQCSTSSTDSHDALSSSPNSLRLVPCTPQGQASNRHRDVAMRARPTIKRLNTSVREGRWNCDIGAPRPRSSLLLASSLPTGFHSLCITADRWDKRPNRESTARKKRPKAVRIQKHHRQPLVHSGKLCSTPKDAQSDEFETDLVQCVMLDPDRGQCPTLFERAHGVRLTVRPNGMGVLVCERCGFPASSPDDEFFVQPTLRCGTCSCCVHEWGCCQVPRNAPIQPSVRSCGHGKLLA